MADEVKLPDPASAEDRKRKSMTTGLILVVLGLIFLGDRLDDTPAVEIGRLWPVILLVLGAGRLLWERQGARLRKGLWLIFLGVLFLMHTYSVFTLDRSWPLFIVAGGFSMMFSDRRSPMDGVR